jgi:hypothetical protein
MGQQAGLESSRLRQAACRIAALPLCQEVAVTLMRTALPMLVSIQVGYMAAIISIALHVPTLHGELHKHVLRLSCTLAI